MSSGSFMGGLLCQHRAVHLVGFALEQGDEPALLVFHAHRVVAGAAAAVLFMAVGGQGVAQLRDQALSLARHLATQPTYGLGLIKRSLNASLHNSFDEQLDLERDLQRLAGCSDDYREGVSAFMDKRSPVFKGC